MGAHVCLLYMVGVQDRWALLFVHICIISRHVMLTAVAFCFLCVMVLLL